MGWPTNTIDDNSAQASVTESEDVFQDIEPPLVVLEHDVVVAHAYMLGGDWDNFISNHPGPSPSFSSRDQP